MISCFLFLFRRQHLLGFSRVGGGRCVQRGDDTTGIQAELMQYLYPV